MDRSRVNRQLAVAVPKVPLTGHYRAFAGDRQAPIVKRQSSSANRQAPIVKAARFEEHRVSRLPLWSGGSTFGIEPIRVR